MRVASTVLLFTFAVGCAAAETAPSEQSPSSQTPAQTQDAIVAEMSGRRITLKEVDDRWQAMDPAERARVTQLLYQNRRNVLDQMVGDALIEEAAKAAGTSVAEYQKQEISARLRQVTDEDIKRFFDENKDRAQGRSIEQLSGPIRDFLAGQRQQQARAQLVDDLKKKSPARILLEPPRQTVEVASDDPTMGPPTAAVTLVEFSDYQ
jgi:hypothetical protein